VTRPEAISARLERIPSMYRAHYRKATAGKSRLAAIKSMCLECVCYERKAVTECTSLGCPLWAFRPFQREEDRVIPRQAKRAKKSPFKKKDASL
jgi:hypothetical protein